MGKDTPRRTIAELEAGIGPAISRHFATTFRAIAQGPCVVRAERYFRLLTGEPHPFGNIAILEDSRDLETAKTAVAPLESGAFPSAVVLSDMRVSPELDTFLTAAGFSGSEGIPVMGVNASALSATALPEGYTFERVLDAAAGEEWTRQLAAGYGLPLGVARYFSPMVAPVDPSAEAPAQFFAVRRQGRIVSTSMFYLGDGLAGIYCVATIKEERGKGLGTHVTAEPLRHAARLGYGVGVLQSSEAGHPVYRRLGFGDFGRLPLYVRFPPA